MGCDYFYCHECRKCIHVDGLGSCALCMSTFHHEIAGYYCSECLKDTSLLRYRRIFRIESLSIDCGEFMHESCIGKYDNLYPGCIKKKLDHERILFIDQDFENEAMDMEDDE